MFDYLGFVFDNCVTLLDAFFVSGFSVWAVLIAILVFCLIVDYFF